MIFETLLRFLSLKIFLFFWYFFWPGPETPSERGTHDTTIKAHIHRMLSPRSVSVMVAACVGLCTRVDAATAAANCSAEVRWHPGVQVHDIHPAGD